MEKMLSIGVDATQDGAHVCLMVKGSGDAVQVIHSQFYAAGKDGAGSIVQLPAPVAGSQRAEREAFELECTRLGLSLTRCGQSGQSGRYSPEIQCAWMLWQAQAALSAPAAGQDVDVLVEALKKSSAAMKAAHDSMFTQCLSNPIKNAWGKPVNVTAINQLQCVASEADAALAAHKAREVKP